MKGVRGGKLKLKGDRERLPKIEKTQHSHRVKTRPEQDSAWIDIVDSQSSNGPTLLIAIDDESSILVANEAGAVTYKKLSELQISSDRVEPTEVNQVFVTKSLVAGRFTFKTAYGKYLSSDSIGKVSAAKEAVGPSEEWSLAKVSGGFALQNYLGKYLSVDKNSNKLRADSDKVGVHETFLVRCQSRHQNQIETADKDGADLDLDLDELETREARKFVSWGSGRRKSTKSALSKDELGEAKASGRLHEALLERRMKSKHDPFC